MANIIFYLDDTLFDTQKLKRDIFSRLASYDIDLSKIEKTYHDALDEKENYSFRDHVKILQKMHNLDVSEKMHEWLHSLDYGSYILPETKKLLVKLAPKNNLILITKGNLDFQNTKIKKSKIAEYFDEVYIIEGKKEKFLKEKRWAGPIYFINDKEKENKKIKEEFPRITVIQNKKGGCRIDSLPSDIFDA